MRNIRKSSTLESKFPLLAVEQGLSLIHISEPTRQAEISYAVFFLVVVLYMAGADQLVCIGLGLTLGSLLVWGTFHLNNKYGEYGLMKHLASKSHPRYILNRRKTNRMFKHKKKEE